MSELRPYQAESVAAVYDHLRRRDDNPCVVLPTGTGKSHVIAQICHDAVSVWGGRVIVLAHVKELLEQNASKIAALLPPDTVGVYSAGLGRRDTDHPVIVAGIQSVYQRAADLGPFDLAIVDEAHLIPPDGEGMYRTFLADALTICDHLRVIGLTATPYRLQGGIICRPENMLNHVCYEAGLRDMIEQGYLSPIRTRASKTPVDLSGVHHRGGEFVESEMAEAFDQGGIVRDSVAELATLCHDRKSVLVFASSVEHAHHIAGEILRQTGESAGVITGETPAGERQNMIRRFKGETIHGLLVGDEQGPLRWLVNVNVLTTGFDAPNVDAIAIMRATESLGLLVQIVGRGLRLFPGKADCIVLDYGGNVVRHGPIDAAEPPEDKPSGTGEGREPAGKVCPNCRMVVHIAVRQCECGHIWPPPPLQIGRRADGTPIMQGDVRDDEFEVMDVTYHYHEKRNAPDAPPTLRVDYWYGLADKISEWVCIEHTGYARTKSERWWQTHSYCPCPATIEDALALSHYLARPDKITVRTISGVKWPEILHYDLGELPEYVPTGEHLARLESPPAPPVDEWAADQLEDLDDIPF